MFLLYFSAAMAIRYGNFREKNLLYYYYIGERSFSFMAPTVWNALPVSLRNVPILT